MRNAGIISCAALAASVCAACGAEPEEWNVPRGKIHVRDPFVVPDPEAGIYRIYASRPWSGGDGVCVIEWGEQFADEIGDERLDVYLSRLDSEVSAGEEPPREVRLVTHDARGEEIAAALE